MTTEYRGAAEILARFLDDSIERYRDFVHEFVEKLDGLQAAIATDGKVLFTMTLTLDVPDELIEAFSAELERASREGP